jgi:hypothetical protein
VPLKVCKVLFKINLSRAIFSFISPVQKNGTSFRSLQAKTCYLYKTLVILYFTGLFCYILFSRVPDYFEGDFIEGVVTKAGFSSNNHEPELAIDYRVGSETFHYRTNMWFLTTYKPHQTVTIIYDPSNPSEACIYSIIGYWIKWPELFISAFFFIALFIAAVFITGKNNPEPFTEEERRKKRKYKD